MAIRHLFRKLVYCAIALLALISFVTPARAQQTTPSPSESKVEPEERPGSANPEDANPKNDRIFLVIPNYTTVENPSGFQSISVKEKFKLGAEDAFDPYSFVLAGILAGVAQWTNDDAAWGRGIEGYGKRYAAGFGDAAIGSFMTTGVFPSIFREDPRYFREGHGGFWHRSGHAFKRLLVTRTDSGRSQFNYSEFAGNAAAAGLSLTYHSEQERNISSFGSNYGTQILIDFASNQLKEFWPDIRHRFLRR